MAKAKVAGPAQYSKRTDLGGQPVRKLPDPDYGEQQAFEDQQKGAPLADSNATMNASGAPEPKGPQPGAQMAPQPSQPQRSFGSFDAPTSRPNEPLTSGVDLGAGPGAEAAGMRPNVVPLSQALGQYAAADPTGTLAVIANQLAGRGMW
jgi:hypothetical protein